MGKHGFVTDASAVRADAGLTGRKIIVDGWGAHGGGSFSGKDPSKTYAAHWIAKSLVKAGLCRRVLIQVRATVKVIPKFRNTNSVSDYHMLLVSHSLVILVFHCGTSDTSEEELLEIVQKSFDLYLGAII
ncbi:hypothetical protein Nmel_008428, partial [Mimus melanotis]